MITNKWKKKVCINVATYSILPLCKHLLYMLLTLHSKINIVMEVILPSWHVVKEKLVLPSPTSVVLAMTVTQYCTKGSSPVTFVVSSEASVMLTFTTELSLESVKDKMYRRITPLGDSGASHWKTA